MSPSSLTEAQLRAELARCQTCELAPCRSGCPANLSPADFILAARGGEPSDHRRAAAHILGRNPLGGVCGAVCPETLCMARCSRRRLDGPVNIPAIQAAIVRRAREAGGVPRPAPQPATGQRVAVVGAGPAGLGAASLLAQAGHSVHLFDRARRAGGMVRLIPRHRLDPGVLAADLEWLLGLGDVHLVLGRRVALPRELLARGFAVVLVTAGLGEPVGLDVPGHERALSWTDVLGPRPPALRGRRVAVVGDGAVAVDCAEVALSQGAAHVELFARRALSELELGRRDRDRLFAAGLHVTCRVAVTAIRGRGARATGLALRQVALPPGQAFHPSRLVAVPRGAQERRDLDAVILALGGAPGIQREPHPRVLYAGDLESGPTSVVEALASGQRAGREIHRLLAGAELAACPDRTSCADGSGCPRRATCPEWSRPAPAGGAAGTRHAAAGLAASLAADFFGRPLATPFLLAAGPYTPDAARLRRAYEAGWAGGVLAAGPLERSCEDLGRLTREFPDRLTLAAAGGAATEDGEADARAWQEHTRRLELAGAMGVEWALQDAAGRDLDPGRAARLAGAVLAAGHPSIPKLFEVSADGLGADAVLAALADVLARHPGRLAGVSLRGPPAAAPLAARHGLAVSAKGALLDYRAAATALAGGARTVQLDAVVRRHGLGVVGELQAGLAHHLAARGLRGLAGLAGGAGTAPGPARDGHVCVVERALCAGCGNCTRCPELAVTLDARGLPAVDPARCTGCGDCVETCFTGALALAAR
jgi:NADPH-dependent glutamate synthase beta subunit-like oxidoreductase/ferredoxin